MPNEPHTTRPAQILIVEDHAITRIGLRHLIGQQNGLAVCGEAEGVKEAITRFDELAPDLVILDLSLRDGDGWEVIRHVRQRWIGVKILVVSSWDKTNTSALVEAGAMGFVGKHEASDKIIDAIRCVLSGSVYPRQGDPGQTARWIV